MAWIVEVPALTVVAKPPVEIVATFLSVEDQVTEAVRSCMLPSLKTPVALNCCWVPSGIEGFIGVTLIELRVGGGGLPPAEPLAELPQPVKKRMAVAIDAAIQKRSR